MPTKRKPKQEAPQESKTGARPIWGGAISFGLVNIPVSLYSLERRTDLSFKMIDSRNHAAIRYERVNEETGEEVPWDQIVKGYEYSKNNYVILEEEDFARVAVESSQMIEIEEFVDEVDIDDVYFEKPYIVVPGKRAEKGYVLLRETLKKTGKVGIARVVIRTRESLAAVMPREEGLVVMLLRYDQELRRISDFNVPKGDASDYKIGDKELKLAEQLVDSMATDWEPDKFKDEYREQLLAYIEELADKGRVKKVDHKDREAPDTSGKVIDLADLLSKSIPAKKKA